MEITKFNFPPERESNDGEQLDLLRSSFGTLFVREDGGSWRHNRPIFVVISAWGRTLYSGPSKEDALSLHEWWLKNKGEDLHIIMYEGRAKDE